MTANTTLNVMSGGPSSPVALKGAATSPITIIGKA